LKALLIDAAWIVIVAWRSWLLREEAVRNRGSAVWRATEIISPWWIVVVVTWYIAARRRVGERSCLAFYSSRRNIFLFTLFVCFQRFKIEKRE
jgi:hypothetical protein